MSVLVSRVSENIVRERKLKNLSQGDLAKLMHVDRSYINSIERGKRNVSLKTIEKIAAALALAPERLLTAPQKEMHAVGLPFVPGLLKAKLASWQGRTWYHQRFDGSPYLLGLMAEAEIFTDRSKKDGMHFNAHYCFFENGTADWYISTDDIKAIADHIVALAQTNPVIGADLMRRWSEAEERFYAMCARIDGMNLQKLSDEELKDLHEELLAIATERNSSSSVIDGFALGTDSLLSEKVKEHYESSALKGTVPFSDVFSTLTTPFHFSFLAEAERELHRTIVAIQKEPASKKKLIQEYRDKYFWIKNNYIDAHDLPIYFFEDEVARIQSSAIDSVEEIRKIDASIPALKEKVKRYADALGLDPHTRTLLSITRDFAKWQDDRKKSTFFSAHYFLKLLKEIGMRVNVPLELLKFESPRRISVYFGVPADIKRLKAIQERSVYYWDADGQDVAYGAVVAQVRDAILPKEDITDPIDFRGLSASTGKAVGKVRILRSVKDIGQMQKGEILVTVMTRPDYVPAMKKAVAIVTNEGGITSHAAIISRELGIPCVIGTKIATEVLKDGELIEVNANHGVVRRLEKSMKSI